MTRRQLVLVMVLAAGACGGEEETTEPIVRPVRYLVVGGSEGGRTRTYSGVAQAGEQSRLSFRVGGTVSELPVTVGEAVEAGQLVAALDAGDYQIQASEAQAAVGQAQAQKRSADATYARVRALYESGNASRQELDSARTGAETAAAAVGSASQRARLMRQQIEHCRLEAPAAGTISMIAVEANENVAPGQVVAVLQSGTELEVRVAVPGSVISRIERGMDVTVAFSDVAGRTFGGTVFEVGVSSAGTSTYPVTVRLGEADDALRVGMSADVTFELAEDEGSGAIRVPSAAVGEDGEGRFVWVVTPDEGGETGTVQRQAVTIGDISAEGLAVTEGLEPGALVVTAGVSRIRDDLEVRLSPRWRSGEAPDAEEEAAEEPPAGE